MKKSHLLCILLLCMLIPLSATAQWQTQFEADIDYAANYFHYTSADANASYRPFYLSYLGFTRCIAADYAVVNNTRYITNTAVEAERLAEFVHYLELFGYCVTSDSTSGELQTIMLELPKQADNMFAIPPKYTIYYLWQRKIMVTTYLLYYENTYAVQQRLLTKTNLLSLPADFEQKSGEKIICDEVRYTSAFTLLTDNLPTTLADYPATLLPSVAEHSSSQKGDFYSSSFIAAPRVSTVFCLIRFSSADETIWERFHACIAPYSKSDCSFPVFSAFSAYELETDGSEIILDAREQAASLANTDRWLCFPLPKTDIEHPYCLYVNAGIPKPLLRWTSLELPLTD